MKHMLLLLAGIFVFSVPQAQVYEWFDEHGNRHFSDQKPQGVEFRVLGDPAEGLSTYSPAAIKNPRPPKSPGSSSSDPSGQSRQPTRTSNKENLEAVCDGYLEKIDRIQSQLRAGYSEPRGNRLRARRSALQSAYQRDCT